MAASVFPGLQNEEALAPSDSTMFVVREVRGRYEDEQLGDKEDWKREILLVPCLSNYRIFPF